MITREEFLGRAKQFKREPLHIEQIGDVHIRELSGQEAKDYARKVAAAEKSANKDDEQLKASAWLAVRVIVDEQGRQLLTDDDIPALVGKAGDADNPGIPVRVLKNIAEKCGKLSGMSESEDAKKND